MTARFWPLYVSRTFIPAARESSSVSMTTGRPKSRPLGSLMVSTTDSYSSWFMNPSRGENPPTIRSSTSQAFLSLSSMVLPSHAAIRAERSASSVP